MDLLAKATTSIATTLAKSFGTKVIERWTRHRAEGFFLAFQNRLIENRISGDIYPDIGEEIEAIISTEKGSEVVFDAYRRVSLAYSKDIGPRIIGILTAELCIEQRRANDFEELVFSMAETLNDEELLSVLTTINDWNARAKKSNIRVLENYTAMICHLDEHELIYVWDVENASVTSRTKVGRLNMNADNVYTEFGSGMQKLKQLGMLQTRVRQILSKDDIEINTIEMNLATLKEIVFPRKYMCILTLIEHASAGLEFDF